MAPKKIRRSLALSIIIFTISLGNYSRLSGTENIRPIHMVSLITCGMAIGIFLVTIFMFIRKGKD